MVQKNKFTTSSNYSWGNSFLVLLAIIGYVIGSAIATRFLRLGSHGSVFIGFICLFFFFFAGKAGLEYKKTKKIISSNKELTLAIITCFVFFCLGIASLLGGFHLSKDKGISLTFDEVSILPNGYYYQQNGKYFLNPEHPPLVKDIAALPMKFMDLKQPAAKWSRDVLVQDYIQYQWGKEFLFEANNLPNQTEKIIFFARASVLFFNTVLLFLIFISLGRIWSKRAALLGLFFLACSQFNLANAMLVTVDFMSAAFTILGLIWFGRWLLGLSKKNINWSYIFLSSLFIAAALLSKFSTILLVPVLISIALGYFIFYRKSLATNARSFFGQLSVIFIICLMLVVAWYSWHVRSMSSTDVAAQLQQSYPIHRLPIVGKTILDAITRMGVFGRAFAEFVHGLLMVNNRIYKGGFGVFFMEKLYGAQGAGPLYFPILYIFKLQLTFHLLALASLFATCRYLIRNRLTKLTAGIKNYPEVLVIVLYCFVFLLISIHSTLQIGLRHIMPVIFGISLVVAFILDRVIDEIFINKKILKKFTFAAILLAMIGSLLLSFPYYLSYYNLLGGGSSNGYKIAADSNYDWGQDLKKLQVWQQKNQIEKLYLDLFISPFLPTSYYFGDQAERYDPTRQQALPAGSYLAVSAQKYVDNVYNPKKSDQQSFKRFGEPIGRAGKSIFIFRVSE